MALSIGGGIRIGGGISILPVSSGGVSFTTYNEGADTFLGAASPAPGYVKSALINGSFLKITLDSAPSSTFMSALNALTTGSKVQVVDAVAGTQTVTLTSGFSGTFTTAGNSFTASIGSGYTDATSITSLGLPGGGSTTTSIAPTYTASPWVINYSTGPYKLEIWYSSLTDAEYIAASTATAGKVVSFFISGTEYRGVVSSVATSTNSFYGPEAKIVTLTLSGPAAGYTLPSSGTPDTTPVTLI